MENNEQKQPEPGPPLNLVQKLAKVRRRFGTVPERGRNDFHKYNYARVADMIGPIGDLLSELNVTVQRRNLKVTREFVKDGKSVYATVACSFVFVDGDAPYEHTGRPGEWNTQSGYAEFEVESYGEGMDTGDKAVYKAFTGAEKYCYRQTFQLATSDADDAERESLSFDDDEPPAKDADAGAKADDPRKRRSASKQQETGEAMSPEQSFALLELLEHAGDLEATTEAICKQCKVSALDQLTKGQAEAMIGVLKTKLAKRAAS